LKFSMHLRQMEYLAALDRERHFGRAAEACHISQSALSQALRSIEVEFGVPIVDRRQHGFHEFTREGELVLDWIRKVLANRQALVQEIDSTNSGRLSGNIRLGVIPVATPMVSMLTTPFHCAHPGVTISIRSMNFLEIDRCLERFEIDAGINYIGNAPANGLRNYVLYNEIYYLLVPRNHPLAQRDSISWREAGGLPLCLLTPEMQNRKIVDQMFEGAGIIPRVLIETNCAVTLCSHVRSEEWFTIVPQSFLYLMSEWVQPQAIPLVAPVATNPIGLVIPERSPLPPIVNAFVETVQSLNIEGELKKYAVPGPQTSSAA
jgi:DNA-binding transcriptional LysR family regulator